MSFLTEVTPDSWNISYKQEDFKLNTQKEPNNKSDGFRQRNLQQPHRKQLECIAKKVNRNSAVDVSVKNSLHTVNITSIAIIFK